MEGVNASRPRQRLTLTSLSSDMNSFADRFSTTGLAADLRRAKEAFGEDEELSEAMWGSDAGFGTLAKGVPAFSVPAVSDVRILFVSILVCKVEPCLSP